MDFFNSVMKLLGLSFLSISMINNNPKILLYKSKKKHLGAKITDKMHTFKLSSHCKVVVDEMAVFGPTHVSIPFICRWL